MSAGPITRAPLRRRGPPTDAPRRVRPELVIEPSHRRRILLWSLAVVTLVVLAATGAAISPLLDVETIEVVGVPADQATEVQAASGLEVGDSIVTFLPGSVAGRVRDLPWVATARVTRDLPNRVRIAVVPRVPVGWTKAGSQVLVVDAESRVLVRVAAPPVGLPELIGVADVAPPGGQIAPPVLARAAEALGPDLRARSASVALEDGSLTAQVAAGPQVRFGAPRSVAVKARVAAAVLARLGGTPAAYVDVTVPAAPVSG